MKHSILSEIKRETGFTLIEVMVGLVVGGLLMAGVASLIFQTFGVNTRTSGCMQAMQQVENAGYWVSQDVQMSQTVTPGASSGFPLQLNWTSWNGDVNNVTYTFTGGRIMRSITVNGGTASLTLVAQSINTNSSKTNCSYTGGKLTFTVTATVGQENASRTYQVKNRPEIPPTPGG